MEIWRNSVKWLKELTGSSTHRAMLEDMDMHLAWDREERMAFAKVARALPCELRLDLYALLWRAAAHGESNEAASVREAHGNED